MRDLNSMITAEALSAGIKVLAPDHAGFSDLITNERGWLIPVVNPEQFIDNMTEILENILASPDTVLALSPRHAPSELVWESKISELDEVYAKLVYK